MTEQHSKLAALLLAIWKGIPKGYKSRYRRNIWQQFEERIVVAAYTNSLTKFVNNLCSTFEGSIGVTADDRAAALDIVAELDGRSSLKLLREETALLVTMVRVEVEAKRKTFGNKGAS